MDWQLTRVTREPGSDEPPLRFEAIVATWGNMAGDTVFTKEACIRAWQEEIGKTRLVTSETNGSKRTATYTRQSIIDHDDALTEVKGIFLRATNGRRHE